MFPGFNRRPAVRGIVAKQLGASDDILQQMQSDLQPSSGAPPAHACQRANTYSWPYYSEANLNNSRPVSRASTNSNWTNKSPDYVSARQCMTAAQAQAHNEACYTHAQSVAYAQYQQRQETAYRNSCSIYANIGCSDSSQELYSSQTSSEQTSPVRSSSRCRRPESPPPIRTHHQLLYLPYNAHYHYQQEYNQQWTAAVNDYNRQQQAFYQQNCAVGATTPQPAQPQRAMYTSALQLQEEEEMKKLDGILDTASDDIVVPFIITVTGDTSDSDDDEDEDLNLF
ncbi:unnamed protein product [Plutella xylostella]|uniref:(diamondback moth) hypothetical protein n=1 Tax=Plutella xylostella TaxID=51655 RepID=A0A8S4G3E2_PLUXY|nr:unnamed protein product [Plutella xylostella]